jgi:fluoride exporter
MIEWRALVAVAIGAAIGGALRYVIGQLFLQRYGPGFPYGTLFINVSGSFCIGLLAEFAVTRAFGITPLVRVFATTGILGGYTTFSAFSLDILGLASEGAALIALAYAGASVIFGFLAAFAGQLLARVAIR